MKLKTWKYALLVMVMMLGSGCLHSRGAGGPSPDDGEEIAEARTAGTVAVGYGVQRAEDVTGAVSSIEADEVQNRPVRHLGDLLQGRFAGVTVTETAVGFAVRIRGRNSFHGSGEPLYVVDGMPIEAGPDGLLFLNPRDVAAIDVLKDAAATAIYGSRGANGVVLITTRLGR